MKGNLDTNLETGWSIHMEKLSINLSDIASRCDCPRQRHLKVRASLDIHVHCIGLFFLCVCDKGWVWVYSDLVGWHFKTTPFSIICLTLTD